MSGNPHFQPYPTDWKHVQPVIDQFRNAPPLDQTPYAEAELKRKSKTEKKTASDETVSIASTSTFASTKALLKYRLSSKKPPRSNSSTLKSQINRNV